MSQAPNDEAVGLLGSLPRKTLSRDAKRRMGEAIRTEALRISVVNRRGIAKRAMRKRTKVLVGLAGGAVAVYALTAGTVQLAPKLGVYVQAAMPSLFGVPPALLQYDPGLKFVSFTNQVEPVGISDSHGGYTVEVLGAYSDYNRTVVFLKTMDSKGQGVDMRPENMILTDQFGLRYDGQSGNVSTQDPGFQYYVFNTVDQIDRQLGVHFTLHINQLMDGETLGKKVNVTGPWTVNWVETTFPKSTVITPNVEESSDGTSLNLAKVVIAPSSVRVVFNVSTNFSFSNHESFAGPNSSFHMNLTGPDGKPVLFLGGQNPGQFSNGHLTSGTVEGTFAPIRKSGTYTVYVHGVLFDQIRGDWVFKFQVPST